MKRCSIWGFNMKEFEHRDPTGDVIEDELERMTEAEVVKKYKPVFAGYGAEHVVFTFPDHPKVVGKVNKHALLSGLRTNLKSGKELGEKFFEDETLRAYQDNIRSQERHLRESFGKHVLRERLFAMRVPITRDLIASTHDFALSQQIGEGVHDVWAMVSIQERAPDVAIGEHALDVSTGYVEFEQLTAEERDDYEALNRVLVDGDGELDSSTEALLFRVSDLVSAMRTSEELTEQVADFCRRAKQYSQATGEILDLVGKHNVVFFQQDGKWDYLLLDAVYGGKLVPKVQATLEKVNRSEPVDADSTNKLLNALNYTRTVNYLGAAAGLEEGFYPFTVSVGPMSDSLYELLHRG